MSEENLAVASEEPQDAGLFTAEDMMAVPPPELIPAGTTTRFKIVTVPTFSTIKCSPSEKNPDGYLMVKFQFIMSATDTEQFADTDLVRIEIMLPSPYDSIAMRNQKSRKFQEFCHAVGWTLPAGFDMFQEASDGIKFEDLQLATVIAKIKQVYDDYRGEKVNAVALWIMESDEE